ncbi:hypothetical protein WAX74_02275 [Psychrobacillus sp. FJAT-51614]|uniref:Uncharacterized protein n=1 Tax=Psychrobacillus mangrovi TaxID=3117745 RepID=A0ABU8F0E1_9BACI
MKNLFSLFACINEAQTSFIAIHSTWHAHVSKNITARSIEKFDENMKDIE